MSPWKHVWVVGTLTVAGLAPGTLVGQDRPGYTSIGESLGYYTAQTPTPASVATPAVAGETALPPIAAQAAPAKPIEDDLVLVSARS